MGPSGSDAFRTGNTPSEHPHPSFPSNQLQGEDLPIVEFTDNLHAPVDLYCLDASLYNSINIDLTFDQITDVQNSLHDVDTAYVEHLYALSRSQAFNSSHGLISM